MSVVAKVIYFQLLWYLSVYLGSRNLHFLALTLCLLSLLADYLIFRYQQIKLKAYILFVLALALTGFISDTSFMYLGLLSWPADIFYPLSLLGIWLIFAAYYPSLFTKFESHPLMSFILGALFGPLAYWTGSKVGAISYAHESYLLISYHAFFWGAFFSSSIYLFKKLKTQVI